MSGKAVLQNYIEEQQKIIQYLQQKYRENTGYEITLPQSWQVNYPPLQLFNNIKKFLSIPEEMAPIIKEQSLVESKKYDVEKQEENVSFLQAVTKLNLPQKRKEASTKAGIRSLIFKTNYYCKLGTKALLTTNFNPTNPAHMIEIIDLSNFRDQKFSKAGLKELLESIVDMRCLSALILRNNGISDIFQEELGQQISIFYFYIEQLFKIQRIKKIDLSENDLTKKGALFLGKILQKETVTHLEWIDLSRNNFCQDNQALQAIITGLKNQINLYHFGLDANQKKFVKGNYSGSETIAKFIQQSSTLKSFSLKDSSLTKTAMESIRSSLINQKNEILAINFRFCFLNTQCIQILAKSLEANRTLIKLDLSKNGLPPVCGIYIMRYLKENTTLSEIDFSKNNFNKDFAIELANCLKRNDVLWKIDISFNPIDEEGAAAILQTLTEVNETLESLGNIDSNINMGIYNIEQIKKALKVNQTSKEMNSQRSMENDQFGQDEIQEQVQDALNEGDYTLLQPILFTNEGNKDASSFKFWNI